MPTGFLELGKSVLAQLCLILGWFAFFTLIKVSVGLNNTDNLSMILFSSSALLKALLIAMLQLYFDILGLVLLKTILTILAN